MPTPAAAAAARAAHVEEIAAAPAALRAALAQLAPGQVDMPYRPGGWTARQVVHHLPDSHLNAYLRFKRALTEESPVIHPYHEGRWAELPEARSADPAISLDLLAAVHARWLAAIRATPAAAFERTFRHPELGPFTLNQQLALYAWHGRHHVAHVASVKDAR